MSAEEDEAAKLRNWSMSNILHFNFFKVCYKGLKEVCFVSNLVLLLTKCHIETKVRYKLLLTMSPKTCAPLVPVLLTHFIQRLLSLLNSDQMKLMQLNQYMKKAFSKTVCLIWNGFRSSDRNLQQDLTRQHR